MILNVFDIEANGYLTEATELHCVVLLDVETELISAYHDYPLYPKHGSLEEGIEMLLESDCLIGHNITGYDLPLLKRLYPSYQLETKVLVDTQRLAELLHPEIKKQSIETWTEILKLPDPKIQISDYSILSQALLNRCVNDVKNNYALFKYLKDKKAREEKGSKCFNRALETEQKVGLIHAQQVLHGVKYDVEKAMATSDRFTAMMNEISEKVQREAPPILNIPSVTGEKQKILMSAAKLPGFKEYLPGQDPFKYQGFEKGKKIYPYTKDLKYTTQVKKLFGDYYEKVKGEFCRVTFAIEDLYGHHAINYFGPDYIRKVKGPYNKVEFSPLNVSSDDQVKDYLLSLGWIPIEYNYSKTTQERTSPKLTEESFVSLPPGLGKEIAEFRVLQHRRNLIQSPNGGGALRLVREDGRVEADAFTCGTPTARYRHSGAVK